MGREIIGIAEPLGDRWVVDTAAATMALVLTRRGVIEEALQLAGSPASDPRFENFGVVRIVAHRVRSERAEAEKLLDETVQMWVTEGSVPGWNFDFCDFARETSILRRPDLLESLLALPAGDQGPAVDLRTTWLAIAAQAAGRHDEALGHFRDSGGNAGARAATRMSERTHSSARAVVSSLSSVRMRQ